MSFANIRMYNAVLPTLPRSKKEDEPKDKDGAINGDDPANQEAINQAMFDVNEDE